MKLFVQFITGLLIVTAGLVVVFLFNYFGSMVLERLYGSALTPEGIPTTGPSIIAFLIMIFIAGTLGSTLITVIEKRRIWTLLGVFCILAILTDGMAIQSDLESLPVWAKVLVMITIPIQIWLGAKLGLSFKKS